MRSGSGPKMQPCCNLKPSTIGYMDLFQWMHQDMQCICIRANKNGRFTPAIYLITPNPYLLRLIKKKSVMITSGTIAPTAIAAALPRLK